MLRPTFTSDYRRWIQVEPEWRTTAPVLHPLPAVGDQDRVRMEIAARYALDSHPGPVGELIHRELQAFLEFGYRFDDGTGLVARLVEYMMPTAPQDASPG